MLLRISMRARNPSVATAAAASFLFCFFFLCRSPSMLAMTAAQSCSTTYTVRSGDTCYAISQSYAISVSDLQSWNPGIDCDNLQIGQVLCVSQPSSSNPSPSGTGSGNGNLFREYIGALFDGVKLSDVPIASSGVEVHLILAFAIDYASDGSAPTNGDFAAFWQTSVITPEAVQAFKSANPSAKLLLSLGGDSVNGNPAQFQPTSVDSWLTNAVSSLSSLIRTYHLDGVDVDYEHFDNATPADFASAVGQLIKRLKQEGIISVASIAPFGDVQEHYTALWSQYSSVFDYVNFQFYTLSSGTSVSQYLSAYNSAQLSYPGGKILTSFSTEQGASSVSPSTALDASRQLQASHSLPGIFIWCADASFSSTSGFQYEREAQSVLADAA